MGSIKDEASKHEPKVSVKNISELKSVDVSCAMFEENKVEFPYKYIEIEGIRYKVPLSVLANLKVILAEKPDLKTFKVTKTGASIDTRYTVIPLS